MKIAPAINLLLFISVLFASPIFAHENDKCSEEVVQGLFFEKVPRYRAVGSTLHHLEEGSRSWLECLSQAAKSPQGQEVMARGRNARQTYLTRLQVDYSSQDDLNLILTPEQEILRRLSFEIEQGKRRMDETKPKWWEVRAQALNETVTRFSLPKTTTDADLEKMAPQDARYDSALRFFRRKEHQLGELLTSRDEPPCAHQKNLRPAPLSGS
ncbi:MAG: hypothetical protein AB7F86_18540 [Bdellovibrionales bacterium]